ncbi:hypothetical protein [Paraburkholderia silviterrae]|nr:hypothetical protein [Paraburkholderia silviterrae]
MGIETIGLPLEILAEESEAPIRPFGKGSRQTEPPSARGPRLVRAR